MTEDIHLVQPGQFMLACWAEGCEVQVIAKKRVHIILRLLFPRFFFGRLVYGPKGRRKQRRIERYEKRIERLERRMWKHED